MKVKCWHRLSSWIQLANEKATYWLSSVSSICLVFAHIVIRSHHANWVVWASGLNKPLSEEVLFFFRLPRRSLSVAVAAWNCKKAWTRVTFQVGWGFVNRLNPGMLPLHCQHPRTPHCGFTFLKYTPKLHRRVYCRTDLFTLHLQCILHLTITCAFRPSTRHADTDRLLMSGVNVITKQDYPCVV